MATRTFSRACVLALVAIMGPVADSYGGEPCCEWIYGKYINLKTGKEVKPPAKGAVAPGPVDNAASAADRYCAKPEGTAPPDCIYSSMKDCRASLNGKAGRCYKF